MASMQALTSAMLLPDDADRAILLGRVWSDRLGGPCPVLLRDGRLRMWGIPATGVLVETLLDRGADGDVDEAAAAVERLAAAAADESVAVRDIWLLRLQAQVSRARGDDDAYRDLARRHRAMALSLGFEGHIAWANADGR